MLGSGRESDSASDLISKFFNPNSFLRIIEEATERYELRPLAYCLMRNHYHAVVHTASINYVAPADRDPNAAAREIQLGLTVYW